MAERCQHVYRSGQLFKGHKLGGVALGRCENECFPKLVVCFEHASKDALAFVAREALEEVARLQKELGGGRKVSRKAKR